MTFRKVLLSNVAIINPRRQPIERDDEQETSFVPMEAVDDVTGCVLQQITRPFMEVKKGYTTFMEGDVIFAKISPCMQNGKHAVVHGLVDGIGFGSTEFHVIRPSENIIAEWIHHFLRSKTVHDAAEKTFTGSVGQQRVPSAFLETLEIPLPPIDEQRRIAAALKAQLAEVEKARTELEAQRNDVKTLKSAIFQQVFSAITQTNRKRIGDIANTTSGTTPSRSNKAYWEPAIHPWVKTGEVAFAPITQTEEAVSAQALKECSLSLLPVGTVLIAMYGQGKTRGQSAVLQVPATTNQACFAILPNEQFEPQYLQYWLQYSYPDMRALSDSRGGNQSNLNGAMLNDFEMPLIPLEQQRQVVKTLEQALAEVSRLEEGIQAQQAEVALLPARLLAQAFGENEIIGTKP